MTECEFIGERHRFTAIVDETKAIYHLLQCGNDETYVRQDSNPLVYRFLSRVPCPEFGICPEMSQDTIKPMLSGVECVPLGFECLIAGQALEIESGKQA